MRTYSVNKHTMNRKTSEFVNDNSIRNESEIMDLIEISIKKGFIVYPHYAKGYLTGAMIQVEINDNLIIYTIKEVI